MKRLLCILSSLDAGGAETFLMKVYRSLPSDQYQLDFVVSQNNGCYTNEVLDRGGKIYEIPMRTKNFFGAFLGIRSIVKENHYNAVLKLGENSLAVMDLIAARLGGAKVLALRSCNAPTNISIKSRCIHVLFRPLLNVVSTIKLAPSQLAAEYMFGKRTRFVMLNNGVDKNVFKYDEIGRENIRNEFNLKDKLVVGHVGRFHDQKNHEFLLEVFGEICRKNSNAILLLVGIGSKEAKIRQMVRDMNLVDRVIFAGQRFDIPQLLSAMDVFVFPSFHEGMPNTVIEAQATGLPCLIADTITTEADITGLVKYFPLSYSPTAWAEETLHMSKLPRKDTAQDFITHGYDIHHVSNQLIELLGMND